MTAVKQKLFDLLPEMPSLIPAMTDETAEQIFNEKKDVSMRIGAGQGEFNTPDDFDENNEEIVDTLMRYALS